MRHTHRHPIQRFCDQKRKGILVCVCVPAAMLVLAELHDVASDVSELQVGIAVVSEVL